MRKANTNFYSHQSASISAKQPFPTIALQLVEILRALIHSTLITPPTWSSLAFLMLEFAESISDPTPQAFEFIEIYWSPNSEASIYSYFSSDLHKMDLKVQFGSVNPWELSRFQKVEVNKQNEQWIRTDILWLAGWPINIAVFKTWWQRTGGGKAGIDACGTRTRTTYWYAIEFKLSSQSYWT